MIPARLACVRHAASVRPEPGSNSYVQSFISSWCSGLHRLTQDSKLFSELTVFSLRLRFFSLFCIVFKDHFCAACEKFFTRSLTAWLVYQEHLDLSTPFLRFFVVFSILLSDRPSRVCAPAPRHKLWMLLNINSKEAHHESIYADTPPHR